MIVSLRDYVPQTSRGGDHDFRCLAKHPLLLRKRQTPDHCRDANRRATCDGGHVLGHLEGQLTRRRNDERKQPERRLRPVSIGVGCVFLRLTTRLLHRQDLLQDWEGKRQRLPRAGLGGTNDIPSVPQGRENGVGLQRGEAPVSFRSFRRRWLDALLAG